MPYTVTNNWKLALAAGSLKMACALRIVRATDGAVFGWTNWQKPFTLPQLTWSFPDAGSIVVPTCAYSAAPPGLFKDVESSEDVSTPDNMGVDMTFWGSLTESEVRANLFDNAEFTLILVNTNSLPTISTTISVAANLMGAQLYKSGTVQSAKISGVKCTFELAGISFAFQQQIVDEVQPTCRYQLGDTNCTVNMAGNTVAGDAITTATTVTSVTDRAKFLCSAVAAYPANAYQKGIATFTSGPNVGQSLEIQTSSSGNIVLREPAAYAIGPGDGVTLIVGCLKVINYCHTVFNNAINFGGEDGVPTIDTVGTVIPG